MNIQERREALGLSKFTMAKLLRVLAKKLKSEGRLQESDQVGTSRQTLYAWEHGDFAPSPKSLALLEVFFRTYGV